MNPFSWNIRYYDISSKYGMFEVNQLVPACSLLHSRESQIVYGYSVLLPFLNNHKNSCKPNSLLSRIQFPLLMSQTVTKEGRYLMTNSY